MADVLEVDRINSEGTPGVTNIVKRFKDMGDGTWAEVVAVGDLIVDADTINLDTTDLEAKLDEVVAAVEALGGDTQAAFYAGQKAMTGSAVAIAGSQALVNGVIVKAKLNNAAAVWVGGATVAVTDDGTGNGYKLTPGEATGIAVDNLSKVYVIGTAADVVYYQGN